MIPEQGKTQVAEEEVLLLFFRSGGESFALDISYVKEVVVDQAVTPVPLVPPSVVGVVNQRGKIFTVMSFSRLVGLDEGAAVSTVVLLHLPDMEVGITVDGIEGIESVPSRLLARVELEKEATDRSRLLRGVFDLKGQVVGLVDAEELVDILCQLPEASRAE